MVNNKLREVNFENRTHYCSNDLISIHDFYFKNLKLDEKPCQDIFIYYI